VLTKKNIVFSWTKKYQESFNFLKKKFTTRPILKPFNPEHTTMVEADSSGYNMGGVLS
jgi:hypothetical protein